MRRPLPRAPTITATTPTVTPRPCRPIGWHEIAGLTPLMALIVLIGVFPKPFLDRIRPSVVPVVANIESESRKADQIANARPVAAPPVAATGTKTPSPRGQRL